MNSLEPRYQTALATRPQSNWLLAYLRLTFLSQVPNDRILLFHHLRKTAINALKRQVPAGRRGGDRIPLPSIRRRKSWLNKE